MKLEHFGMAEPGDCRLVFTADAEELERAITAEQAAPDALWDVAYYQGRYYVYFGVIPCLLFPTIEDIDVSVFSLYETYEMLGRKPVMAQEKLDIEALGARDAGLLGLEQGDLALTLECVSFDASGQAIEYVKSFNRGDAGGYTYTY